MDKLSDNYYYRQCFLKREQVPTQSIIRKTMKPPLAAVYFKSMRRQQKVLAGLEPPMKGGGGDWYQPPKDILKGRAVLKPIKKEYLQKLSCDGIVSYGEKFLYDHHMRKEEYKRKVLEDRDLYWKNLIEGRCRKEWETAKKMAAIQNTLAIKEAMNQFQLLYITSLTKLEQILFDAAYAEIVDMKEEAYRWMQKRFDELLKQQATMLKDRYTEKLRKETERLKLNFIKDVEDTRSEMSRTIHDLRVEKHVTVDRLRHLLESQNLACQIYVALKEREACYKEMDLSQHEHKKEVKKLEEKIAMKNFEVQLEQEKQRTRQDFIQIWQKKVCHVVKRFQKFITFCLNAMPEQADFFIDMEKLMMLQLDQAILDPEVESVIKVEDMTFHTPVPRPHPYYLFCDKGFKPTLDQDLCPKHCTSSASQMPVVVVNKRCIYAACDNFKIFTEKVNTFLKGERGDVTDFTDNHVYEVDVPVKITSTQQLFELKLESSILQVLQNEIKTLSEASPPCPQCEVPYCFCEPFRFSDISICDRTYQVPKRRRYIAAGKNIETRSLELIHEREPKWESYFDYIHSKKIPCPCAFKVKKHLKEHLPSYMRTMSKYEAPTIPGYETCDLYNLKRLVKKAQGKQKEPPPDDKSSTKMCNVSTQYSDQEVDLLCNCFSRFEIEKILEEVMLNDLRSLDRESKIGEKLDNHRIESSHEFAAKRILSLRNMLDKSPELEEIFKKTDC